jgi:hypothetical protein
VEDAGLDHFDSFLGDAVHELSKLAFSASLNYDCVGIAHPDRFENAVCGLTLEYCARIRLLTREVGGPESHERTPKTVTLKDRQCVCDWARAQGS